MYRLQLGIALLFERKDYVASKGSGAVAAAELPESHASLRQPFQQRRRFPPIPQALLEIPDALVNFFQAEGVFVPHRPAAMRRKAVAVEIDYVDVASTKRDAFFEQPRAFVHQRVNATVDNFLGGNLALWDAGFGRPTADECREFRIRRRLSIFVIFIPTCTGLL